MSAPKALLDATIDILRRHAPYDRMDRDTLEFLAARLHLNYFPKGAVVTSPDQGIARKLFIIQRGLVRGRPSDAGVLQDELEHSNGDSFPLASIMGRRPTRYVYTAEEDCFCYEADAEVLDVLVQRSPVFLRFCTGRVNALLQQSYALLHSQHAQRSGGQQLTASLSGLLRRPALHCRGEQPLREALIAMGNANVGSIVVIDAEQRPVGIFTERDLLRIAAQSSLDLNQPMQACMTPGPYALPISASAAEAAVLMARHGIRHVVVTDEGRLKGVVSERDLFALQRTSMRGIVQALDLAAGDQDLVQAAADIRAMAGNLLAQGVGAEQLIQLIATLNDRLCGRILSLEATRHDLADIRICWIALGSEGRLEQTLSTDQDNGIIFESELQPGDVRAKLLPFAHGVNTLLDRCGFPLCKGNIMAGNPQWCLSSQEWRDAFDGWHRNPLPQALLNAAIFYDFRPVWGDELLAVRLRQWLADQVKSNQRFLRALAVNAMESKPPLGFFTDFAVSGREGHTIDLKAEGVKPFVDGARILALASSVTQTNTAARLRGAGEHLRIPREEIDAITDSFHYVQLLRLRQQLHDGAGAAHPNRVDPDALNELDRRILKEAFRQARKLQKRISLDYQL